MNDPQKDINVQAIGNMRGENENDRESNCKDKV